MHRTVSEGQRAPVLLAGSALLVAVASFGVRLALLGRQSYWLDEVFSVNESAGSVRSLQEGAATEVHPPLFAALLWVWIRVGGHHEVWTRGLSVAAAATAVVVAHRGLRHLPLGDDVRWALTAATAAGGTAVVYSMETRSYALLLLASVGLTVRTLRAALPGAANDARARLGWAAWGLLAATTHLFGAFLVSGAVVVLVGVSLGGPRAAGVRRARRALGWVGLGAAACSLQAAWLLAGVQRPGFAAGTQWIPAPGPHDVLDLVTTTFGSGGLRRHRDGFAWTSPVGALAAVALVVAAAVLGWRRGRAPLPPAEAGAGADVGAAAGRCAALLLALGGIVIGSSYAASQSRHLWTLRNLIVVTPALTWGVVLLAVAAAGDVRGRRAVAGASVGLLGLGLVPIALGVARPYKTDVRGLVDYLVTVRQQQPDALFGFVGSRPPDSWRLASERPADDPVWSTLYRRMTVYPVRSPDAVVRTPGAQVVVLYRGVVDPALDAETAALVERLGGGSCHRVALTGIGVVRCG